MAIDWVHVSQMLGAESHQRREAAAAKLDPMERQRLLIVADVAFMLRDALAFSMDGKDKERAFDVPPMFRNMSK